MTRRALPARRPNETVEVEHLGQRFSITVGFDPETGRALEVFADGIRGGSALAHVLSDACVWGSLLLQHGCAPSALGKSLGTVPGFQGDEPASVLGAIAEVVARAAR